MSSLLNRLPFFGRRNIPQPVFDDDARYAYMSTLVVSNEPLDVDDPLYQFLEGMDHMPTGQRQATVGAVLGRIRQKFLIEETKIFSDVVSTSSLGDELQWVDLVLAGGVLLGIAHVGYVAALEAANIRFRCVGSCSAGAILAAGIGGLRNGNPSNACSDRLLKLMHEKKFEEFLDGPSGAEKLTRLAIDAEALAHSRPSPLQVITQVLAFITTRIPFALDYLSGLAYLFSNLGLHPGEQIQRWMRTQFFGGNAMTLRGLQALCSIRGRRHTPGLDLRYRESSRPYCWPSEGVEDGVIAFGATDVTTQSKVIFSTSVDDLRPPHSNAHRYYENSSNVGVTECVRASMSVPLLFQPVEVTAIPNAGRVVTDDDEDGWPVGVTIPSKVILQDGGLLSNFPFRMFHRSDGDPSMPTFGIDLLPPRYKTNEIENIADLAYAAYFTASEDTDNEYLELHPDTKYVVQYAEMEEFRVFDFYLDDETKMKMFAAGVAAGVAFLERFDWDAYKTARAAAQLHEELAPERACKNFRTRIHISREDAHVNAWSF